VSKTNRHRKAYEIIIEGHGRDKKSFYVRPDRFAHYLQRGLVSPVAWNNPATGNWEQSKRVARRCAGVYWLVLNGQLFLSELNQAQTPSIKTNIGVMLNTWLKAHNGIVPKPSYWREFVKRIRLECDRDEAQRIIEQAHSELIEHWRYSAAVDRDPRSKHMDAGTADRERQRARKMAPRAHAAATP
jgi:hypothetical protein